MVFGNTLEAVIPGNVLISLNKSSPESFSKKKSTRAKSLHLRVSNIDRACFFNFKSVSGSRYLKSERGFGEADNQRIAQASIVRRHYLKEIEKGRHVIVVGDLNDRRGDPTLRRIRGLDDIGPDLIQTGLFQYFEKDQVDQRWTYIFQGRRQQIDHILVSDSLKPKLKRSGIKSSIIRVTDPEITDHSPLIVTLNFR